METLIPDQNAGVIQGKSHNLEQLQPDGESRAGVGSEVDVEFLETTAIETSEEYLRYLKEMEEVRFQRSLMRRRYELR